MANRGRFGPTTAAALMLAALLTVAGCGGSGKSPATDVAATPWEVSVESPLGQEAVVYPADSLGIFTPDSLAATGAPGGSETDAGASAATAPAGIEPDRIPDPKDFTEGWRVQLSANSTLADADGRARGARAQFTEPVYVEYEPPFYKVRVGDFLTRAGAESMATRARAEGYEGAWVVETLVLRPVR